MEEKTYTFDQGMAFHAQESRRTITPEGFLLAPATVAKSGIYQYYAHEINLDVRDGLPKNKLLNVYRPDDEVFSEATLDSYNAVDITNEHPSGALVDANNYKNVVAGTVVSKGRKVGADGVEIDMLFKDPEIIKQVQRGKVEVSAGYRCYYEKQKGVTKDGAPYDYVQRGVVINHVALVASARGGKEARVADNAATKKGELRMDPKAIVTSDGRTVLITQENGATIENEVVLLKKEIESLKKTATADTKARQQRDNELKALQEQADKLQGTCDAQKSQIEELEAVSSDSAILKRVQELAQVKEQAAMIATHKDTKFTCDSAKAEEVRRECLAQIGVATIEELKDKADSYVHGRFDTLYEQAKTADAKEAKTKEKAEKEIAALHDGQSKIKRTAETKDGEGKKVLSRAQQYVQSKQANEKGE